MVDHSKPLTYEQQLFASEHHDVIYEFLRAFRLPESEYYDVVVFGYINAVRKYTETPELREWAFTTIAFWSMRSSLGNESRKAARQISAISLDAENEDGLELYGVVAAPDPEQEDAGGQYTAQYVDLLKALTKRQLEVLTLKASGFTSKEIATMIGAVSAGAVDHIAHRGRAAARMAERERTAALKEKVDQRLGRITPLEDFAEVEVMARRKLATYKTAHPTYRPKESAVARIAADLMAELQPEPVSCGGGGTDCSLFMKGGAAFEQQRTDHHQQPRAA